MNEFDFTQMKNLKAPEEWVENAVNIPKKKQKSVFVFLRPQFIGSAAAVVLVTAAVLMTLLLQHGAPKPSLTPAPMIVTTAATEPFESVPESTTQAAAQTTAATEATKRETVVPVTESTPEHATAPAKAPSSASPQIPTTAATAPATNPQSPTQPATQSATETPTQPATQTATEPAEAPAEETVDTETDPANPPVETVPRDIFYGEVTVRISPKCPLYQSKYLYIAVLDSSGRDCSHYTIARKLTDGKIMFPPQSFNIYLYNGEDYILRVYSQNGLERRAWFTPSGGNIEIYIND